MATETIILDFQVETGDAIAELEKTKKSIIGLKEEQAALNKAYKEGAITVDEYAQESVRVEQVMKKETATYATLTKAVQAQSNSINALTAQNKALKDERNNLDLTSKKGVERLNEINKQIDRNTEAITKNVSKLEQQKINIGNYASALDGIVPGFSAFTKGVEGGTTAAKAFIATPLGAVIGAIGLAVGALTAYFKGSEEGQNRLNKIVQIGTTIFEKFMDVVEYLGEKVFDGLAKGIEVAAKGFDNMAKFLGINTQIIKDFFNEVDENAKKFYETEKQIAIQERALIIQRAATAKEVAKLREEAISQDGEAKKKTIEQAIALEKELSASEVRLAKLRETLAAETVRQRGDDKEAQKEWVEATAARIGAEAQAYEATLRFQKELEKINDQQAKVRAEQNTAIQEEIRLKNELAQVNDRLAQQTQTEIQETPAVVKGKIDVNAAQNSVNNANQIGLKAQKDSIAIDNVKSDTLGRLSQSLLMAGQYSKELAIAGILASRFQAGSEIVSNTGIANAKAVAASPLSLGQPWVALNTIAAGISIGSLIANAATAIAGITKAAGGGTFMTKGPQLLMVGDNPGGRERVTVEPISGRGKTVVGKNMIRLAGGGVVETQSATGPINQSFAFRSAMNNQPTIVASWKEATELNTRIQFKESLVTL
jgi:hypothetical protein